MALFKKSKKKDEVLLESILSKKTEKIGTSDGFFPKPIPQEPKSGDNALKGKLKNEGLNHQLIDAQDVYLLDRKSNQDLFVKLAQGTADIHSPYIREAAIRKLIPSQHQKLLSQLLETEKDDIVLTAIIEALEDQNALRKFVSNSGYGPNHARVFHKLGDHQRLKEMAFNAKWFDQRRQALRYLEKEKLIAKIAQRDENEEVRAEAVNMLQSSEWQELLEHIARNDKKSWVREEAVAKLDAGKHGKILVDIALRTNETDDDLYLKMRAILHLDKSIHENELKQIRKESDNPIIQRCVTMVLSEDQEEITDILTSQTEYTPWEFQEIGIGKILAKTLLEKIAREGKDTSIRISSLKKLKDEKLLKELALNDSDYQIREFAHSNLSLDQHREFLEGALKSEKTGTVKLKLEKILDGE